MIKNRKLPHIPKEERINFNVGSNKGNMTLLPFYIAIVIVVVSLFFVL